MNPANRQPPSLPDDMRIYVISDIHGCADLLDRALAAIDADIAKGRPDRLLHIMLGDYIDRGADTRLTLDVLLARSRRYPSVYLKGNHEDVLLGFLRDPGRLQDWRQFGGLQTLISYGLKPSLHPDAGEQLELARDFAAALPPEHKRLLEGLKPSYACGDYFFCHAGVRPGVALSEQREEDLLWIRDEFLNSDSDFGKFIIHGHTPVRQPDLRANRLNIDTGAYATGRLTVLRMEGITLEFLDI